MLDKSEACAIIEDLQKLFVNAFFTIQLTIPKNILQMYVNIIINMVRNLGPMVIHLSIEQKGITFLMDERFDLRLIDNFKDNKAWTYIVEPETLCKGYMLCHHILPMVRVLSPIVWSPEGHA